jgi:RNA polymerase sigma-70 factor (ECF subfamily)
LDKAGFKIVFDKYFDSIRRYVYYRTGDGEIASDLAQDVFMRLWEKRDRFTEDNIKGLLYKMASDYLVSEYRRRSVAMNFLENMTLADNSDSPLQMAEASEVAKRYADVLARMPDGQRTAFLMHREEELKYKEIAERLDVSLKAVEKRISGALKLLKDNLLR